MYYQKTIILQLKSGQKYKKNTRRLQCGAMKMVQEILSAVEKLKMWCCAILKQDKEDSAQNISLQS